MCVLVRELYILQTPGQLQKPIERTVWDWDQMHLGREACLSTADNLVEYGVREAINETMGAVADVGLLQSRGPAMQQLQEFVYGYVQSAHRRISEQALTDELMVGVLDICLHLLKCGQFQQMEMNQVDLHCRDHNTHAGRSTTVPRPLNHRCATVTPRCACCHQVEVLFRMLVDLLAVPLHRRILSSGVEDANDESYALGLRVKQLICHILEQVEQIPPRSIRHASTVTPVTSSSRSSSCASSSA